MIRNRSPGSPSRTSVEPASKRASSARLAIVSTDRSVMPWNSGTERSTSAFVDIDLPRAQRRRDLTDALLTAHQRPEWSTRQQMLSLLGLEDATDRDSDPARERRAGRGLRRKRASHLDRHRDLVDDDEVAAGGDEVDGARPRRDRRDGRRPERVRGDDAA